MRKLFVIWIIVGVIFAVLLALGLTYLYWWRMHRKYAEQRKYRWQSDVEQAKVQYKSHARVSLQRFQALLASRPKRPGKDASEIAEQVRWLEDAIQTLTKQTAEATAEFEAILAIADEEQQYDQLWKFDKVVLLDEEQLQKRNDRLGKLVKRLEPLLLQRAIDGDVSAFVELRSRILMGFSYGWWSSYYFPEEWDELIVRYVKSPQLSDFQWFPDNLPVSEIRLIAAKAIREKSLLLAQVALAYCDYEGSRYTTGDTRYPYRKALGDVLIADLAKAVVSIQTERQLTFGA